MTSECTPWPAPSDQVGWQTIVLANQLARCPPGVIVAALRALNGNGSRRIVNALADHVSALLIERLRCIVGRHHPNDGDDIILEAHDRLMIAIADPEAADGSELANHFFGRVKFRAIDAIRASQTHQGRYPGYGLDPSCANSEMKGRVDDGEEAILVEDHLRSVEDPRKRLAFRLYMEGMRIRQGDPCVASVLGVDPKTAKKWIEEARMILRASIEIGA
jgi:DNA-directed RNA polymerase specialized sigma24 family protein